MRFDSINIPAFGPFTKLEISFPNADNDIHLIYGENEAGKSSLLRAIHNLLYEIPVRSEDGFIHSNKNIRIGATISHGKDQLTFTRKKGNKGTLLDSQQNTIDESELKSFYPAVDADFFNNMFGLNTQALRAGSGELLNNHGNLATTLFSVSLGGSPIDVSLKALEDQADCLFKGAARAKVTIPPAIAAYKEYISQSNKKTLTANAWENLQEKIKSAKQVFTAKHNAHQEKQQRRSHVENLLKSFPHLHDLEAADDLLDKITLPELPEDFPEQVRAAQNQLSNTGTSLKHLLDSLEQKKEELTQIPNCKVILEESAEIESLHQNISKHEDQLHSIETLTRQITELEAKLNTQLEKLEIKSPDALRKTPVINDRQLQELEGLAEKLEAVGVEYSQAKANMEDIRLALKTIHDTLEKLDSGAIDPALSDLNERIIDHAADQRLAKNRATEIKEHTGHIKLLIKRLGLQKLDRPTRENLSIPSTVTLRSEQKSCDSILLEKQQHNLKIESLHEEILSLEHDLEQLAQTAEILTEKDLKEVRDTRDQQWQKIRKSILSSKKEIDPKLTKKLTRSISKADTIVDTLRNHAAVIAKAADRKAQIELKRSLHANVSDLYKRSSQKLQMWADQWQEKSNFLPTKKSTPAELIEWRQSWEELADAEQKLDTLLENQDDYKQAETSLLEELQQHFSSPASSFSLLKAKLKNTLAEATSQAAIRKNTEQQQAKLNAKLEDLTANCKKIEQRLNEAKKSWSQSTRGLQLAESLSPRNSLSHLRKRQEAKDIQNEIEEKRSSLTSQQKSLSGYLNELSKIAKHHLGMDYDASAVAPRISVTKLWERLCEARKHNTRTENLTLEIKNLEEQLRETLTSNNNNSEVLKELGKQAGVGSSEGLDQAIITLQKRAKVAASQDAALKGLRALAGATGVEQFIQQARNENQASLELELAAISSEIGEVLDARDQAREALKELIDEQEELEKAGDDVIHAQQQAANELAKVVHDSERFIRLQHAIAFLKDQIEAYRKQTQGPMIEKTTEFFNTLTNGAFTRVAAQKNDKDEAELVAIRPSQTDPEMEETLRTSALSEGTRDQLFLALRLAAIDLHLENHPPMPLILDDILVTFDDARTQSVFRVLEALARKTQVLIFTHHPHTISLAKKSAPSINAMPLAS